MKRDEGKGVVKGIGDDMAILGVAPEGFLIASDMLMDGVDFDAAIHGPRQIGRKALAVNLSDCAAMAVRPCYVLVSVALPAAWSMAQAQELFIGIETLAAEFDCEVVGGDTNSWSQGLVIDVTVIAKPFEGILPVRRDGAQPGDAIFVSGRLGGSLAGHHLDFEPRVREAAWLARELGSSLHAMMDLSDGLSTDGARMAEASGCAMVFNATAIEEVASDAAREMSQRDERSLFEHALNDGEDFELLFAVAASDAARLIGLAGSGPKCGWKKIGVAEAGSGICLEAADGQRTQLERGGWQHFR